MSLTTRLTFSNITPARVFSSTGNDIYYTGNVGIGKSNPAVALDVSGNMTITGNTTICGSLVTSDSVSLNLGNTNAVYSFGSNALVIDTFTNRVGIGKTNPSVLLDISGNTTICGTLYVSNINGNDLGTGSIATQWTTSNSNIFYRTGNVGIGKSNPTVVLDVSGSSAVSGNVAIGKSSASSSLDVSGNAVVNGNVVVSRNLTVDSTTLVVDASNNRVGIGLANPSVALHISGGYFIGRPQIAILEDRKTSGTGGGPANSTVISRTLNSKPLDDIGITLTNGTVNVDGTSNQFTVPAGTYRIFASAPAYMLSRGHIRLLTTSGNELVRGPSGSYGVTNLMGYFFTLSGVFTLALSTTLYIEQYTQVTSNDGQALGVSVSRSGFAEIYTTVELTKLA